MRWIVGLLLSLVLVLPANAQDDAGKQQAREAFRLGTGLARQGQWADALAAFERSNELHPHPTTVYNIGYCERALSNYTRARRAFLRSLAEHAKPELGELTPLQLKQAQGFLRSIDIRLARAVVTIVRDGTEITVDGSPLQIAVDAAASMTMIAGVREPGAPEAPPTTTFVVVLDPKSHVFAMSHPDGRSRAITVDFDDGETKQVELDVGRPEQRTGAPVEEPPLYFGNLDGAAYTALAGGGIGLIMAIVGGVVALDAKSDLDAVCPEPGSCPPEAQDDIDRLHLFSGLSTVGVGVAVAGAALGVTLLFLSEPDGDIQEVGVGVRGVF